MQDDREFPLQQGQLDWLCSAYAAINLLALRGRIKTVRQADRRFASLVTSLPGYKWNLARYLSEGIDPDTDIHTLFYAAGFSQMIDLDLDDLKTIVSEQGPPGHLIYLVELGKKRPFSHYTLIKGGLRDGGFELYDSCGFTQITQHKDSYILDGCPITIKAAWRVVD